MERHEIRIADGDVEIEAESGWATVGSVEAVEALVGETYEIEYTSRQSATAWLNTDSEDRVTIELREALDEFALDPDRASDVLAEPTESGESGHSKRAETFADRLVEIFDLQGADR
ncbi:hypothetical protein [Halococcoides cellulosivorans]|uniref:Uncharacterized protein n=1 Tax=Halococcoides cellulosivorans TaxID=1679096 RepID=A0A2R4WY95_9EURY|nr:hypothetical protein [Halococcoides cellulosivorans]AWB26503.1 hypothetical protein HARCEL1_01615 [Halococcoides cellulosivorans]